MSFDYEPYQTNLYNRRYVIINPSLFVTNHKRVMLIAGEFMPSNVKIIGTPKQIRSIALNSSAIAEWCEPLICVECNNEGPCHVLTFLCPYCTELDNTLKKIFT